MQILLANAKIMRDEVAGVMPQSMPTFGQVASLLAAEMARMEIDELARQLHCSATIAAENWVRYREFAKQSAIYQIEFHPKESSPNREKALPKRSNPKEFSEWRID